MKRRRFLSMVMVRAEHGQERVCHRRDIGGPDFRAAGRGVSASSDACQSGASRSYSAMTKM
jgi:hypothetical protein